MKKRLFLFFLISIFYSLFSISCLYAAEAANIQLAIATPDPVVAGEEITFQVIAVNVGSKKWSAGQYYVQAEVFDAEKKYLAKTPVQKGTVDINPGMTNLFYMPFPIPNSFVGAYFYKVYVVYKEQRLVESEYYSFNVVPLPVTAPKPSKFKIGGNSVLSYKQSSKYGGKDYTGNFSLNLVGQIMEKAMLFNLYTFHTPKSTYTSEGMQHEIYTILFNYYGDTWSLGLGDVLPTFSPLSLYGTGMRGGHFETTSELFAVSFVGARTAAPVEGTSSTDGTFERWLIGGRLAVNALRTVEVGASYLTSYDRQESLTIPGPSITPASNGVSGATAKWEPRRDLVIDGEYQNSQYWSDLTASSSPVSDYAYRFHVKYAPRNLVLRTIYQVTRPNFYSFGSPGATRDRQTVDISANYRLKRRTNFSLSMNQFKDNLDSQADKVTTTQNIYTLGVAYISPGVWPNPSVSYSMNEAIGDPKTAQENFTNTMTIGLVSSIKKTNLGLTFQQSSFRDKTLISDDLDTNTIGFNTNSSYKDRLLMNLGMTLTNTKNITDTVNNQSPAYSFSVNYEIFKNKLGSQVWGTMISRQNDAINASDMIDEQETLVNIELSWLATTDLSWTVGSSSSQLTDNLDETNNSNISGFNTRISYSF